MMIVRDGLLFNEEITSFFGFTRRVILRGYHQNLMRLWDHYITSLTANLLGNPVNRDFQDIIQGSFCMSWVFASMSAGSDTLFRISSASK